MATGKNAVVIQQTSEMLEVLYSYRYKTMQANNCIDGVRKIVRYRPDLVIAEADMPNLNGLSMSRILNKLQIDIPVILTSYVDKYQKQALSMENVTGFVLNPQNKSEEARNAFRTSVDAVIRQLPEYERKQTSFQYHFRQHEWANLIGISRRKKILVVEDNDSFRTILLRRLDQTEKYALFSAKDGLEGVLKAFLTSPDLIITDIIMPVLDGMAMSQIFYVLNKPFPIVILTARDDEKLKERARRATGVLDYLSKGIMKDPQTFLDRIDNLMRQAETMRPSREALYQKGAAEALGSLKSD